MWRYRPVVGHGLFRWGGGYPKQRRQSAPKPALSPMTILYARMLVVFGIALMVLVIMLCMAGCSTIPTSTNPVPITITTTAQPSLYQQVQGWAGQCGAQMLNEIGTDDGVISDDLSAGDLPDVSTQVADLLNNIPTWTTCAEHNPDPEEEQYLSDAVNEQQNAANDLNDGIVNNAPQMLDVANAEITTSSTDMQAATERVDQLKGE
jgi:uncharacterized protein YceK